MKILHENLGEGVDPDKDITPSSDHKKSVDTSAPVMPMISMTTASEIYTEVNVAFRMDVLEAVLYNGETNLQETVKV